MKTPIVQKLNKAHRGRIHDMETYKINCGKNLLVGLKSIKSAEETSIHKDDFVHLVIAKLEDYNKPVIVKVYDAENKYLNTEIQILQTINNYRNTAKLICDFSCADNKNRYLKKIQQKIKFCNNGNNRLHFFIYEYITGGDISDFLIKQYSNNSINQNIDNSYKTNQIISLILQITCVIIELGSIYKIHHGDINSGNILIDNTPEETLNYTIDENIYTINTYGIMPKIIDFGRSSFYNKTPFPITDVWDEIIMALHVINKYIVNNQTLKNKLDFIISNEFMELNTLTEYYTFIVNNIM